MCCVSKMHNCSITTVLLMFFLLTTSMTSQISFSSNKVKLQYQSRKMIAQPGLITKRSLKTGPRPSPPSPNPNLGRHPEMRPKCCHGKPPPPSTY
ncbi:hypothetical protein RND81_10G231100 [Saponaria officinalis]|uniref:Transmembrane protein n=1 Tax=Saponaria officinalis TaxID=3572 RepID=A0AAW1I650_SAPOF